MYHIGNLEIGKYVECRGDRNMALVFRRLEQVACIVEIYRGTDKEGNFLNNK
jgi:hypothetical protein